MVLSLMSEGSFHPWKCCRACAAMGLPLELRAETPQMLNMQMTGHLPAINLEGLRGTWEAPNTQEKDRENRVWRPLNRFLSVWCMTVADLLCLNWSGRWRISELCMPGQSHRYIRTHRGHPHCVSPCLVPTLIWNHKACFQLLGHSSPNFAVP